MVVQMRKVLYQPDVATSGWLDKVARDLTDVQGRFAGRSNVTAACMAGLAEARLSFPNVGCPAALISRVVDLVRKGLAVENSAPTKTEVKYDAL